MKLYKKEYNGIYIIILVFIIISLIIPALLYFFSSFEKIITIKEKYVRYRRYGSSYNIIDSNNNIYQIGNLWFKGDFNRADDYAKINIGDSYKVKGYGLRIPFFDIYKQIYYINKV